jgi:signal transduction histidine kinase
VLTVRDTGSGIGPGAGAPVSPAAGFGLAQVRERLATRYGASASLTLAPVTEGGAGTVATIRLPLTSSPSAAA